MRGIKKQNWKSFFNLLGHSRIPWIWYMVNFALSLGISMLTVKLPQMTGEIMQGEIFDRRVIGTYVGVTLCSMAISFFSSVFDSWIRLSTDKKLQNTLLARILRLPLPAYQNMEPSSFITRVTKDTSGVSRGIANVLSLLTNTWTIFLMLKTVYEINVGMVLAMTAIIPWIVAVAALTGRYSFRAGNRMQESLAEFTSVIAERLSNIKGIKIHGEEEREWRMGMAAAKRQYEAEIYRAKVNACSQPFIYSSEAFLKALMLIYGGILISRKELEPGEFITMYLYLEMLPVFTIQYILIFQDMKGIQGAAVRAGEILREPGESVDRGVALERMDGDIVFRDVTFGYHEKMVLCHADFRIPAGKTTVIVGPSGSGKTTVLKLLERFYVPGGGKILLEGKELGEEEGANGATDAATDISSIRLRDWREKLGYVPQNAPLLSGTVWENLTYGWKRKGDAQSVVKAAEDANAYGFISRLPQRFETEAGEKGNRFSAGERQRLAIARALAKDPQCLLLDEATCNLDPYHASKVQESVGKLRGMRTCVIVAHDMKIARHADHIIVLEQGAVCGEGSHEQLYNTCDTYRSLVHMQWENQKAQSAKTAGACVSI